MLISFDTMKDTQAHFLCYEPYVNKNKNPTCERTISCLKVKLNFGKDTHAVKKAESISENKFTLLVYIMALLQFILPFKTGGYILSKMTINFKYVVCRPTFIFL